MSECGRHGDTSSFGAAEQPAWGQTQGGPTVTGTGLRKTQTHLCLRQPSGDKDESGVETSALKCESLVRSRPRLFPHVREESGGSLAGNWTLEIVSVSSADWERQFSKELNFEDQATHVASAWCVVPQLLQISPFCYPPGPPDPDEGGYYPSYKTHSQRPNSWG